MFSKKAEKKSKEAETFDELQILRENDRIRLHIRYISGILGALVIWLIATGTASDSEFPNWVSFASTITSIVLSVLAIILSITGEGKTEHIKEQLIDTAKKINESQAQVTEINACIENNLGKLNEEIKKLSDRVDEVPQKTAQQVTQFKNTRMRNTSKKSEEKNSILVREWENPKE